MYYVHNNASLNRITKCLNRSPSFFKQSGEEESYLEKKLIQHQSNILAEIDTRLELANIGWYGKTDKFIRMMKKIDGLF